jgi:uncharacterized protein YukJ
MLMRDQRINKSAQLLLYWRRFTVLDRQQMAPIPTKLTIEVHHDLDALAGTWSHEDATAFEAATLETRQIDAELWQ